MQGRQHHATKSAIERPAPPRQVALPTSPPTQKSLAALPAESSRRMFEPAVSHLLAPAIEQAMDLGMVLPPVTSIEQLHRLRQELRAGVDSMAMDKGFARMTFGPPPLPVPDDLAMEPLRDFARLREESERMHHCIGSPAQRYVRAILAGEAYAWHVAKPEATLFVERVAGRWVLTEAQGFCNAPVPAWLLGRLRAWLAEVHEASGTRALAPQVGVSTGPVLDRGHTRAYGAQSGQ